MQHVLQGLLSQSGQTQTQTQPIKAGSELEIPCHQLMESINRIQNMLEDDSRPRAPTTALDEQTLPDLVLGSFSQATLRDIMETLPSRQVRRQHETFWGEPAAANLLWVSILFSVLATGAVVLGA